MGTSGSKSSSSASLFAHGSVKVDPWFPKMTENYAMMVTSLSIHKQLQKEQQGFYHHFVVVEVSKVLEIKAPGKEVSGYVRIRAERYGPDELGNKAGITVKPCYKNLADSELKVRLSDLNVKIPMSTLLKILTDHCPDFSLLFDNCWKYADYTFRALLSEFGTLQPQDRQRFSDLTKTIPRLYMPVDYLVIVVMISATGALLTAAATLLVSKIYEECDERRAEDEQNEEQSDERHAEDEQKKERQ